MGIEIDEAAREGDGFPCWTRDGDLILDLYETNQTIRTDAEIGMNILLLDLARGAKYYRHDVNWPLYSYTRNAIFHDEGTRIRRRE